MQLLPKNIIDRVSIKNVKENFGHDLCGFFCDLYFDKKKVGYYNNDGWGGIPDVSLYSFEQKDKDRMIAFEDFLTEENFAQFIADDYNKETYKPKKGFWDAKDFNFEAQVEFLSERLNFLKSIEKKQKNAIIFGNPRGAKYSMLKFRVAIDKIKAINPTILENKVAEIKAQLKDNEFIFNTNL